MNISKLLLPRDRYEEEEKKYSHAPITFEIKNDKQSLFYFGANHSHNPLNYQYPALKKYWNEFAATTKNKDRIVLVEGGVPPFMESEDKAILTHAESGLVTLLAHQVGIIVSSPDISISKLRELLPNLNKNEVILYFFLSWLNNFQKRANPKPDFEKSAKKWVETHKQKATWGVTDISLSKLKKSYKQIIGKEFNEKENPNNLINPNKAGTPINKVARAQSDLRDAHITEEIARYWNEGKSIFVVFGQGHLIIQKPALEIMLNQK